jgi:hypothetical protein
MFWDRRRNMARHHLKTDSLTSANSYLASPDAAEMGGICRLLRLS